MDYSQVVSPDTITKTSEALEKNGFTVYGVENGEEAKQKVLSLIPEGSEVMTMTSITLDTIKLTEELNQSGKYDSVRMKLNKMNREEHHRQMQRLGAAPQYAVGSVHAVTEEGVVLIASNSGSQLPAYVYGSDHVIWVVGAQKIVPNLESGMKRLYDYVLPLESERAHKAYGVPGSFVSKLLIYNREPHKGRITIIIVKEALGY